MIFNSIVNYFILDILLEFIQIVQIFIGTHHPLTWNTYTTYTYQTTSNWSSSPLSIEFRHQKHTNILSFSSSSLLFFLCKVLIRMNHIRHKNQTSDNSSSIILDNNLFKFYNSICNYMESIQTTEFVRWNWCSASIWHWLY